MSEKYKDKDGSRNTWGSSSEKRSDSYANRDGDGATHCHGYNNKETGERGVAHRGVCEVCRDNKGIPFDNRDKRTR